MKNLFKGFVILFFAGMLAAGFVSCSSPSNSSSGPASEPNVVAKYKGYLSAYSGAEDIITIYDDCTWKEECGGTVYTKGTYEIIGNGNERNGIVKLKVTESKLSEIPVGASDTVTIVNGSFSFMGTTYTIVE